MIYQGVETVGKLVDNPVKWTENIVKPEMQEKVEEVANKAEKHGFGFLKGNKKLLNDSNYQVLPSTSPANASQKPEYKLKQWKDVITSLL